MKKILQVLHFYLLSFLINNKSLKRKTNKDIIRCPCLLWFYPYNPKTSITVASRGVHVPPVIV